MFYKVEILNIVHEDIRELTDYIFRVSLSKEISQKIYNTLYKKMASLNFMPNRFQIYVGKYRRMIVDGKYKILYHINEHEKKVNIIRVTLSEVGNIEF